MKVKELIKMLSGYEDFDIVSSISFADNTDWGVSFKTFDITGICDIGHSNKVIVLDNNFYEK